MSSLGNFIRLHPLHTNELPAHPALNSVVNGPKGKQDANTPTNVTRPPLLQFVKHILFEASEFAENAIPNTFTSKGGKKSPPSYNDVELSKHSYSSSETQRLNWQNSRLPRQWSGHGDKPAEHWCARRSRHANHSEDGTATFSEFNYGLRQEHSEHEMAYTPEVYDCFEVLNWNEEIRRDVDKEGSISGPIGEYTEVRMDIREMCHQLPFPLSPRTFPVLVVTAKGPRRHSFIIVHIPLDISNLTAAYYSNGRNISEGKKRINRREVVLGVYTSIERVLILPDQNVEWLMATASDAKGWLPMWVQKLGVPGAVIKDVGLFMKWIIGERSSRRKGMLSEDDETMA